MKKNYFLISAVSLFSTAMIAQVPQLFKYQGLARDSSGNPISNSIIALRISIHQGTPAGTVVYKETHNSITNEFGSFSINIGAGTVVIGNFSTIPWSRYNYFQEVEMDVTGGTSFISMGTSQYLSIPYALAADSARSGVAPFWIQNTSNGGDTASVAIIAIANTNPNGAPVIFCKNVGMGTSLYAESGNGIFILGDSNGLKTNGRSQLGGNVLIDDSLQVNAHSELTGSVYIDDSLRVNGHSNFMGNVQVNGTLEANFMQSNQISSINGLTITGSGGVHILAGLLVNGDVHVNSNLNVVGTLSKGAGSFKIDHPLDPMNKFLYHSFVESPDMKNIYDGTVTTDVDGNAVVELPNYFEALNRDFRYQLTAIGQFAQAIVSDEISNNKFSIKTDKPNVKISWQVTGIRKDAYAEKNRIVPEVEKTKDEKGKYLYPDAYR